MDNGATERMFRPGGFRITERAISFCRFQSSSVLIDVGCGEGATVRYVRDKYSCDIVGIDPVPHAGMLQGCAEALPFEDSSADGIFFECSFSLTDAPRALEEARRVLKPRGYLVLADVYARGEAAVFHGALQQMRTKSALVELLRQNGFRLVLFEDYSHALTSMMAQMIMDQGCEAFYQCMGADIKQVKNCKPGYCLLIACKVKSPVEDWTLAATGPNLKQYTQEKLQDMKDYVYKNSVFYGKRLAETGELGLTCSEDLADKSSLFLCKRLDDITRVVTLQTSGTQGKPKRIFFTLADLKLTVAFFRVGMSTMVQAGDKVMILMPCSTEFSIGDLLRRALEQLGCESIPYGPVINYWEAIREARAVKPDCIVGIPSQVLRMAREAPDIRPKMVLLSADYVAKSMRAAIEEEWGCEVFEHYGSVEMGLGGGVECACHCGYHMRHADMHFEIINPKTGEPVPHGQYGEVVFTTLTREAMPLMRYRTGDISRILDEPCACGATLPRLDKVIGRLENLKEQVSIHALDELLFHNENILDYNAKWVNDTLLITVQLKHPEQLEEVRAYIQHIVPAEVVIGDCGYTTGVKKRKIERIKV